METQENIKINSSNFGELEIEPHQIFNFENGILGFENLKDYVIIAEDEYLPLKWLISLDNPDIGFPIISPWIIEFKYKIGRDFDQDKQIAMVIVTIDGRNNNMTANLKAPVIFDLEKQTGNQIILPTDRYSTYHKIVKDKNK